MWYLGEPSGGQGGSTDEESGQQPVRTLGWVEPPTLQTPTDLRG